MSGREILTARTPPSGFSIVPVGTGARGTPCSYACMRSRWFATSSGVWRPRLMKARNIGLMSSA
jgi:hypothetical protein